MKKIYTRPQLAAEIADYRATGLSVGFVPTMGALHNGHLSLIRKALSENDRVVCSIFVNPTQFNDPKDLKNYPRPEQEDLRLLEEEGCHLAFLPQVQDMYPEDEPELLDLDLKGLDTTMEGAHRPGHFRGVITVVKRLFDLVTPDKAYFGEKDYQQLQIIRFMTRKLQLPIEVVTCATVRSPEGLAMSSRNSRLDDKEYKLALILNKALRSILDVYPEMQPKEAIEAALAMLEKAAIHPEYLCLADGDTLGLINSWNDSKHIRAFIAAPIGPVRLIDNIRIS